MLSLLNRLTAESRKRDLITQRNSSSFALDVELEIFSEVEIFSELHRFFCILNVFDFFSDMFQLCYAGE